jgi:hypothetical protein
MPHLKTTRIMEEKIDVLIHKYELIYETLRNNKSLKTKGDDYNYEEDMKNVRKFVSDLLTLKTK